MLKVKGISIECIQGNIVQQPDMEAIVNAANAQLRPGGGVAGAIHKAAGSGLEAECRALAPIRPGQAVISGGHNLPNRYVIHCLGPVYGVDEPTAECWPHVTATPCGWRRKKAFVRLPFLLSLPVCSAIQWKKLLG